MRSLMFRILLKCLGPTRMFELLEWADKKKEKKENKVGNWYV